MKSISQRELEALFFATDKTQFVSFVAVTSPAMRKRENPHPDARKVSWVNGVLNFTYSKTVNRQRGREQKRMDFTALERKWGMRVKNTPLVSHCTVEGESRLYLEVKVERRRWLYFDPKTNTQINEDVLAPFLREPEDNPRQQLDVEVIMRDYRLTNIAALNMGGEEYLIAPAADELHTYLNPPKPEVAKRTTQRRTPKTAKQPKRGAM